MEITKKEFARYVNLRMEQLEVFYNASNKPKELSIDVIEKLTDIPKEKIIYIQEHLIEISDKFFSE